MLLSAAARKKWKKSKFSKNLKSQIEAFSLDSSPRLFSFFFPPGSSPAMPVPLPPGVAEALAEVKVRNSKREVGIELSKKKRRKLKLSQPRPPPLEPPQYTNTHTHTGRALRARAGSRGGREKGGGFFSKRNGHRHQHHHRRLFSARGGARGRRRGRSGGRQEPLFDGHRQRAQRRSQGPQGSRAMKAAYLNAGENTREITVKKQQQQKRNEN